MPTTYAHTNIICKNCEKLAAFYVDVFDCKQAGKAYELYGDWLNTVTNMKSAKLKGITLKLPGFDLNGPELELFQYDEMLAKPEPIAANREGIGHLAFKVDNVEAALGKLLAVGGSKLGEIVNKEFKAGTLTCTYAKDLEGNLIELQKWTPKDA